jgi:tetratricopeptide (TPR) repeat protein
MQAERIKILEKEIELEPTEPFNYYALALEYKQIDKVKAQKYFEFLLENHPDYLPCYYISAQFYFDNDLFEKAEKTFIKGIALAQLQGNEKAYKELKGAYALFLDETE